MNSLALRATICGTVARRILRDSTHGRVAAVFDSSFYIRSAHGVACIGDESLPRCPLNVVTDACRGTDWRGGGLRVDTPWKIFAATVYLGDAIRIRFGNVRTWRPHRAGGESCRRDLKRALRALRDLAKTRVPDEGLGILAFPCLHQPTKRPVLEMAREPWKRLRQWLESSLGGRSAALSDTLQPPRSLVGLGPGLTPSGDDLLGGVMLALHAFGREDVSDELWRTIRPWALDTGNFISLAHLSAASEGQGSAAIHGLLLALQTGDCSTMLEHLRNIDRIGHTSGWDTLAGVLTVADVLQRIEREKGDARKKGDALIFP